ncbi:MAG: helix-turn-helix domain-containing protein [Candidatus Paceibacterota bacterium]
MQTITLIIIGLVAIGFGYWLGKRGRLEKPRVTQTEEKKQNLEAIMGLMESGNQPLTNYQVEQMLGIPESTVTRYFDELEKAGKVRQVGTTGQGVFYEKI